MKDKKKRTKSKSKKDWKRNKVKYPDLNKGYNSAVRQEYLDYDYLDQLSDKEKEFLNGFTAEHLASNFFHKGKKHYKTKKDKRKLYNENNSRNRCLYGRLKNKGVMTHFETQQLMQIIETQTTEELNVADTENAMIEYIDSLRKKD